MYNIEKKVFGRSANGEEILGYKLTFGGFIQKDEMSSWVEDSRKTLENRVGSMYVLVDMRTLKPLDAATQEIMVQGQQMYKERGMQKSSVMVDSVITAMQFKKLAKESGIYAWERYFAGSEPQYEKKALDWLVNDVDPDKK